MVSRDEPTIKQLPEMKKILLVTLVTALAFTSAVVGGLLVDRAQAAATAGTNYFAGSAGVFFADPALDSGTATSSVITVGTSASVRAVATSTSANWIMLQNNSANSVYLRFGADKAAAANTGVLLTASSTLQLSTDQYNMYRGSITAIATGGTASVLVNEY